MVRTSTNLFELQFDEKEVALSKEAVIETLGVLPYEIIMILRDCYPEGKFFKELKRLVEERLEDWLKSKNKSPTFTDQAIYYQLRKLKDLGLIETSTEKGLDSNDRLITSQNYHLASLKFLLNFSDSPDSKNKLNTSLSMNGRFVPSFLESFFDGTKFNGFIVLGENSKDAIYLGPIFYLLSQFFELFDLSKSVIYDKKLLEESSDQTKNRFLLSQNLILVGGPNANTVYTSTIPNNNHTSLHDNLPIKFLHSPESGIIIREQNRVIYTRDQSLGVIQIIDNPWNPTNKILTISGAKREGTEALVNELTISLPKIEALLAKKQYCLVRASSEKGHLQSEILENA